MKIHVSFPRPPDAYGQNPHWHGQVSYFVYRALREEFGAAVDFLPWSRRGRFAERDILVTFRPNANMLRWKRTIAIENDSFDVNRWHYGRFLKHGLNARLDDWRHSWDGHIKGILSAIFMSNDVALRKWSADSVEVRELKDFYLSWIGSVQTTIHPLDKPYWARFMNPNELRRPVKMLVYNRGWRKNSLQLIDLLREMGYVEGRHFDVTDHFDKTDHAALQRLVREYSIVANCSYSESGPVNMIEYLAQGLLVFGHEEWWDGYGLEQSRWSYDPRQRERMQQNLRYLFDEHNFEQLLAHRNRIWQAYMDRADNEWSYLTGLVIAEVHKAIAGPTRAWPGAVPPPRAWHSAFRWLKDVAAMHF